MVSRTLIIIVVAITVAFAIGRLLAFTPRSAEVNSIVCPSGFEGTRTDQEAVTAAGHGCEDAIDVERYLEIKGIK